MSEAGISRPAQTRPQEATTATAAPLFPLGQVVATPAALAAAEEHLIDVGKLLARHERGDSPIETLAATAHSIITEADRSVTTVLRPGDY